MNSFRTFYMPPMIIGMTASCLMAQATPVRSNIESFTRVELDSTGQEETDTTNEDQAATLAPLGPVVSTSTINVGAGGFFTTSVNGSAQFDDAENGSCSFDGSFQGSVEHFSWSINSFLEYDFILPADGVLHLSGTFFNPGNGINLFGGALSVMSETEVGAGFNSGSFFNVGLFDLFNPKPFDYQIPLEAESGSYRLRIRLGMGGTGGANPDLRTGALDASWQIVSENPCPADINGDGQLNFFDVGDFLAAYGDQDPVADFDGNGKFNFFDVGDFLTAYTSGCP